MRTIEFDVEKTPDATPVFLISLDGTFLDNEFCYKDIISLRDRLSQTIEEEEGRS